MKDVKFLASTYTSNQTGALTCYTAGLMWGLTHYATVWLLSVATSWMLGFTTVTWILLPLYVMRIKWGYIAGILVGVIALFALLVFPFTVQLRYVWYTFPDPVFNFTYIVFCLFMLACIYFSYKSYEELK